ncbi:rRNA N6-adenosine-methyltransferase ZCCHC4 isoform X2 [Ahaetulla prasina]|uniref:rRNA N6-adenosine-methyltransferase ZCCHC4 isoform X2 n=1 Tax=Ahaetulla prasina TaxID=499056 RepID=UPI0026497263|nr:rRNA N6-adenosine-methyltransferase ZCCHC4 isoform X2 [Ahaetulla prasina]
MEAASPADGVTVVFERDSRGAPAPPECPHGPTLLFARILSGKREGRRFYACSACRERKDCHFFQWEDEKISEARLSAQEKYNRSHRPSKTHSDNVKRYKEFIALPPPKRKFCQECQQLLLIPEWERHSGHPVLSDISAAQLRRPSQLLSALENKKTNAQYLFTDRSCLFLLDLLIGQGFRRVLCVGTPRLHELIQLEASSKRKISMKSLLLDIDFRYSQFYPEEEFCHYNMFNHYFFAGEAASRVCEEFLQEDGGGQVVVVADPPFGGLVEALATSFQKLRATWSSAGGAGSSTSKELPILWIFPYFFEPRILEFFPSFTMLDYQKSWCQGRERCGCFKTFLVDYDNHALYKHGKKGRKQSPVRIFTNLSPGSIVLPAEEGYRFCPVCQRYVSAENRHCDICNSCTSKDGRCWTHCNLCKKCVKPSWVHCSTCGRCALPTHPCEQTHAGCFICGEADHKRTTCPNRRRIGRTDQDSKKVTKKKKLKRVFLETTCWKKAKMARKRKKKT